MVEHNRHGGDAIDPGGRWTAPPASPAEAAGSGNTDTITLGDLNLTHAYGLDIFAEKGAELDLSHATAFSEAIRNTGSWPAQSAEPQPQPKTAPCPTEQRSVAPVALLSVRSLGAMPIDAPAISQFLGSANLQALFAEAGLSVLVVPIEPRSGSEDLAGRVARAIRALDVSAFADADQRARVLAAAVLDVVGKSADDEEDEEDFFVDEVTGLRLPPRPRRLFADRMIHYGKKISLEDFVEREWGDYAEHFLLYSEFIRTLDYGLYKACYYQAKLKKQPTAKYMLSLGILSKEHLTAPPPGRKRQVELLQQVRLHHAAQRLQSKVAALENAK